MKTKAFLAAIVLLFLALAARAQTCTVAGQVPTWDPTLKWTCAQPTTARLPPGNSITMLLANASVTGTTVNRFAKLGGAPSTAIITATSDTDGAIGVCTADCGTTGSATIAIIGQVTCDFDNATVAGDYVTISAITAGKCHDAGAAFPNATAAYGRVLSTNGASGAFVMELMTPDIAFQNAGNGKSKPGTPANSVQFNVSSTFTGDADFLFTPATNLLQVGDGTTNGTIRFGGSGQPSIGNAGSTDLQLVNGPLRVGSGSSGFFGGNSMLSPNAGVAGGLNHSANSSTCWTNNTTDPTTTLVACLRLSGGRVEVDNGTASGVGSVTDLRDFTARNANLLGYATQTNCSDSAGAAACGSASAGSVVIDAGATTVVVSTTSVTANSQIFVTFDSSLGTRLGITCNVTPALPTVSARTAATSFTIATTAAPAVNAACYSYFIVN